MDSRRQKVVAIAIAGAFLVLIAIFSKSWFKGESAGGDDGSLKASVSIGLTGGQSCAGDQCQSISLGQVDDNWSYVGIGAILCGLATLGVAGYLVFLVLKGRAGSVDPKKLALPAGAGAAAAAVFLFIKPPGVTAKMSWAGFVAILGFGASAGAIFLAQRWLAGMMPARPPLPQQYGGYYNGGYGQPPMQQPMQQPPMQQQVPPSYPPQQQAYYPPQGQPPPSYPPQQQAYGSEPPVQRIMPTMPRMAGGNPSSQPPVPMVPMQPGSQPPVPMMQKQSTTIPPGSNPCPRCGTGLAYSSSHGKWYCARCQAYV